MDNSETYTKMCEKAEGIQGHFPDEGDFYFVRNLGIILTAKWVKVEPFFITQTHKMKTISTDYESGHTQAINIKTHIWLPRQDQLQEMLLGKPFDYLHKLWDFSQESDVVDWDSMEQLWLGFVMKTLYSKTWNGSEWITSG